MSLFVVWVLSFGLSCQVESVPANLRPVDWQTGAKFLRELDQPFSGSWNNVELRDVLVHIAADRRVAILLDRRLDPSIIVPVDVTNVSLKTGITGIARLAQGDVSVLQNVVYLGPKSATRNLRTLIELRGIELQSDEFAIPGKRQFDLLRRRTIEWGDLETPREILEKTTAAFQLNVVNADAVPHDLWAAMVLTDCTVTEALSVVLIQFDLTFRWIQGGTSIELIPVAEPVFLQRKHRSKQKPVDALALIRQRIPKVSAEILKSDIIVTGLLEEHEAVADLLRGAGGARPIKIAPPKEIRKREFTLTAERVPLSSLMKKLEESAINFEFDPAELDAAGIDLEQLVQCDLKKVSADTFFKALFVPAGLNFQIEGLTVKLTPGKPANKSKD